MDIKNVGLLIALSAIWGSSFIFMRYLSPLLGAVITADLRLLIAGLFLVGLFGIMGVTLDWRKNWRQYLIIGTVNSGLPFFLYSFAALHIPASISVIINSMAPIFGSIFSVIWLHEKFNLWKLLGFILGTSGVILVASLGPVSKTSMSIISIIACVTAAMCYGLAGVYVRTYAAHIKPRLIAAGSQLVIGLVMFPLVVVFPPKQSPVMSTVLLLIVFSIFCSAVAYMIFYRLVANVGPTKTLTVTFLMPAFGMLWGHLFLGETITFLMILGALIILTGTFLVSFDTRLLPASS
jgi:drug/metabolite transporter (DMT)-like permease